MFSALEDQPNLSRNRHRLIAAAAAGDVLNFVQAIVVRA